MIIKFSSNIDDSTILFYDSFLWPWTLKNQTNQNKKKWGNKYQHSQNVSVQVEQVGWMHSRTELRSAALRGFRETRKKKWKQSVGGELNFMKMELWAYHWNDLQLQWSLEETHRIQHFCLSAFPGKLKASAWPWYWWELKLPQGRKSICCHTRTWAHSHHNLTHRVT